MLIERPMTKIEEMLKEKLLGSSWPVTGCMGASGQSSPCPLQALAAQPAACARVQHTVGTICERVTLQTQFTSAWGQLQSSSH